MNTLRTLVAALAVAAGMTSLAHAADPAYFTRTDNMCMTRAAQDVLLVEMNTGGGPFKFTAMTHEAFVDALYHISRDRDNKIVILTGPDPGRSVLRLPIERRGLSSATVLVA